MASMRGEASYLPAQLVEKTNYNAAFYHSYM